MVKQVKPYKQPGYSTGNPSGSPGFVDGKPLTHYHPSFPELARDMAKQGWSEAEMAMAFGVRRSSMRAWAKVHPEFKEALLDCRDFSLAWWEREGRTSLRRQGFNSSLYSKIVSSRFRDIYSDRVEHAGDQNAPMVHRIERRIIRPAP